MNLRSTFVTLALLAAAAQAQRPFLETTPGKPGTAGLVPALSGAGSLFPGSSGNLAQLEAALPNSSAALVLGFSELALPFQGGVLGPTPDLLLFGLPIDGSGSLALPFGLATDIPVDSQLWVQFWVDDPGASFGRSASNTLQLTVQPVSAARMFPGLGVPLPRLAEQLHLADLDGDGLDDVVAPMEAGGIALFAGDGAGALVPLATLPLALEQGVPTLDSGDLDGDGQRDLLFVRHEYTPFVGHTSTFVLASGLGGGAFDAPEDLPLFWSSTATDEQLVLTDLDADGQLDLVALADTGSTELRVLTALGAGDGSFDTAVYQDIAGTAGRLAVGDLDGDGAPDVVVASDDPNSLQVLLNTGAGSFAAPFSGGAPAGALDLLLRDVDGDGVLDAVAVEDDTAQLAVWPGLGDGGFGAPLAVPAGPDPGRVAVGDVDGDGLVDLAVTNRAAPNQPGETRVSWVLGQPGGGFGAPVPLETGHLGAALALGDVDGDGRDDLLMGHGLYAAAAGVALYLGRPTSEPLGRVSAAGLAFGNQHMVAGDLGADGVPDIVTSRNNGLYVLTAGPGGAFASGALYALGSTPSDLALADMTGDGLPDVIFPNLSDVLVVVPGLGGAALSHSPLTTSLPVDGAPQAIDIGDLDGDGLLDVVVSALDLDGLRVLLGHGDGTFEPAVTHPTFVGVRDVVLADVDLDGDLDTLTANGGSNRAAVQRGAGDGSLTQFAVYLMGENPRSVGTGDFDGDGVPDLVTANNGSADVSLRPGLGNGTFAAETRHALGGAPWGLTVGDVDDDGWLDLVAPMWDADLAGLLLGEPGGGFAPATLLSVGEQPSAAALVDLDLDGRTDLALIASQVSQLRVLMRD